MDRAATVGRTSRPLATCCLALLLIPVCVVAWFWYDVRHTERVNDERLRDTLVSVLRKAREDGASAARALGTSQDTGTDALTGLIWKHTEASVITYDAGGEEFTATAFRSAVADQEAVLLSSGPELVRRCLRFTYVRDTGRTWTSKVTVLRDDDVCRPSERIGSLAELARRRLTSMYTKDLTTAGVRRTLALPKRAYDVRSVVRQGRTVTVGALVRDDPSAAQCYRYTRPLDPDAGLREATVVAAATC